MRTWHSALAVFALLTLTGDAQAPDEPAGTGQISGRVLTSAAQPVADSIVALGLAGDDRAYQWRAWWAATTDAQGFYQFDQLPAGRFTVIAARDGFAGWASIPTAVAAPLAAARNVPALEFAMNAPRRTLELVPRGRASDVNLTLYRPAAVSGRALSLDGSAAAKVRVMLYTANEAGVISSIRGSQPTDINGRYSFPDLPSAAHGGWGPVRLIARGESDEGTSRSDGRSSP